MSLPDRFPDEPSIMRGAIELARRGIGRVEPNPAVGAVLVGPDRELLAAGFHERFGGPHAEVQALSDLERRVPEAAERRRLLATATLYVTLEPCCHHGKTPPCSRALIDAGVKRVVVGLCDPSPHASGGGLRELTAAGLEVRTGLLEDEVRRLNAPFLMLVQAGRPWVHAKWAMTLDGKLATRTGDSRWISNDASRAVVHALRGRMDAIVVGAGTARADDPLLTVRPPGPRTATRIVVDPRATLSPDSQLARTAADAPVMLAVAGTTPDERTRPLAEAGIEILRLPAQPRDQSGHDLSGREWIDPTVLLSELGRRRMTNVLIEGGGALLGSFHDAELIDEVHVFVAPKLLGGSEAITPVAGTGPAQISQAARISPVSIELLDVDVYLHGPVVREESAAARESPSAQGSPSGRIG